MATQIDVPALFRLWNDRSRTMAEVARDLGISECRLRHVARQRALPERPYCWRPPSVPKAEAADDGEPETLELSPWVQQQIRELKLGPYSD